VRRALIERSSDSGISIISSDAVLEGVQVASTMLQSALQLGDGVSVTAVGQPASAILTRARITNNARAGIASFGASVSLGVSIVSCNAIDLNGEAFMGFEAAFTNLGGNGCGCEQSMGDCHLQGSTLAPPEPVAHR
jgi:hypothetical protein